jgi:hypothetical protein
MYAEKEEADRKWIDCEVPTFILLPREEYYEPLPRRRLNGVEAGLKVS